ncbi:16.4 kDa RING/U box [Spodoptera frugiperda ascovirus 1a]|uniref:16.4 kDa RING/U box n=1 Tax=Spodoptera frugiperda ascovirus 1a TaxID=113370 RepID=Q0E550_SFAVA|nr:16.4 kDa RING/U box [Spodoptera frugiperda ascovirus 1a]CAL44651.1 16.4 kDa RING/U box [Spodoptera frugiperda ascovirus 1a]
MYANPAVQFQDDDDEVEEVISLTNRRLSDTFILDMFRFSVNALHPRLDVIRRALRTISRKQEVISSDKYCVVCFERFNVNYGSVYLPCRHSVICETCSIDDRTSQRCPYCRTTVEAIMYVTPNYNYLSRRPESLTSVTKL